MAENISSRSRVSLAGLRSSALPLLLSAFASTNLLVACHKDEPHRTAPSASASAEPAPTEAAVRQSLEGLKPQLSTLNAGFAELRKQVEKIPANFPEFGDIRAKFYAVVESLGVTGAKLNWLSERVDTAVREGKPAELAAVSKDIAQTYEELKQAEQTRLKLLHEIAPFALEAANTVTPTFTATLRSGYVLTATENHLEQRLLLFLDDPKRKVDKTTWFDFDPAFVAGGNPELDKEVFKVQLENVAQILKAYPETKLEIGGFTDDTATAAANKKLSTDVAQEVKKRLVELGVAASRLEAAGYGAAQPVCPKNDTPECKAKNRRIAVRVTAK